MSILKRNQTRSPNTGGSDDSSIFEAALKSLTKLGDEKRKELSLTNVLKSFSRELKGGFFGALIGACLTFWVYDFFGIKSPLIWFIVGIVIGLGVGVFLCKSLKRKGWL